jgi:hypothetical protein
MPGAAGCKCAILWDRECAGLSQPDNVGQPGRSSGRYGSCPLVGGAHRLTVTFTVSLTQAGLGEAAQASVSLTPRAV